MELEEQVKIDRILRNANAVAMSRNEKYSVLVEGIDPTERQGQYDAAYFICTLRQSKLSGKYRPTEQVIKLGEEEGVKVNTANKEPDVEVNLPFFAGGL